MADIVAQLAPSADQRRSSVIGDGKGLDYPLRAAPVAILIGDPYFARSADRCQQGEPIVPATDGKGERDEERAIRRDTMP